MKITETKIRTIQEEIIKEVLCNGCEKNIWTNGNTIDGAKITFDFEYGSCFDGEFLSADLCDDCFIKIRDSLKIPPKSIYDE